MRANRLRRGRCKWKPDQQQHLSQLATSARLRNFLAPRRRCYRPRAVFVAWAVAGTLGGLDASRAQHLRGRPTGRARVAAWPVCWPSRWRGGCLAILLLAAYLRPSPSGMGTHQQGLGLPACNFLRTTGLPCPSCGMTTSFAWFAKGNLLASAYVQPMGTILALLAAACVWGGFYIAPHRPARPPFAPHAPGGVHSHPPAAPGRPRLGVENPDPPERRRRVAALIRQRSEERRMQIKAA